MGGAPAADAEGDQGDDRGLPQFAGRFQGAVTQGQDQEGLVLADDAGNVHVGVIGKHDHPFREGAAAAEPGKGLRKGRIAAALQYQHIVGIGHREGAAGQARI